MIAKISSGHSTRHLINYLYGPGRANEHTDPHLVASWDGFAPDPGRHPDTRAAKQQLTQALDLRVNQARHNGRDTKQHVWHCSLRATAEDRILDDEDWAAIARRVVAATGIAPDGDPDGCRWIAVRHADDHIHIAATTVRGDLRNEKHWNDYLNADRELQAVEKDYGLTRVVRGDRTAAKRATRAEQEKAHRTGHSRTAREHLRTTVRTAVAAATSTEEFLGLIERTDGVTVQIQHFPSGDVRGYKIALNGDTNAKGEPVWFSGSTLAPDLSLPKIRQRLDATEPTPTVESGRHRPDPWHQATSATERIPHRLDQGDDPAAQAHLAALGEALDALPLVAPQPVRAQLREAAATFERATRSRTQAEHQHARALRGAVRSMLREPVSDGNGAALVMFLDAAVLAVIAAARWHQLRHHDQQVTAARKALTHLQGAYDHTAAAPLRALAQRRPPQQAVDRHIQRVRQFVPDHAQQILDDPAVDALTTALTDAEMAGHDPARLLQQATDLRALDDARHPARVLTWRVQRLSARPAPSARALAAQARSTVRASVAATPVQPSPAAVAAEQPRHVRRR